MGVITFIKNVTAEAPANLGLPIRKDLGQLELGHTITDRFHFSRCCDLLYNPSAEVSDVELLSEPQYLGSINA